LRHPLSKFTNILNHVTDITLFEVSTIK